MSEVLKFKEYRKIIKALDGVKTSAPKEETIGDWVREKNRSLFGSGMRWYNRNSPVGRLAVAMEEETKVKDANGKEWILKPDGTKILASLRNPKPATTSSSSVAFSQIDPEYRDSYKDQEKTTQQSTTTGKTKATIKSKITPKGPAYWNNQYKNFLNNMTDDLKAWLALRGIDYSSALKMQEYLLRIGKSVGKFGADNKWGGDSQIAWENFVNTTMKNNPLQTFAEEKSIVEQPVVDAPDPFGYKTANTYEDDNFANKVKALGIRSNADLINFMHNSGKAGWKGDEWSTQFRNDVDRALGGDYSDANIRRVFKTKNNWGEGFMGRGDYGDFQNALQTNAGVWNGIYDAKQNETRMNTARQQYANKLAQQYAIQVPKLTIVPSNKFMIGNAGTNTLGNAGVGLGEDWMKYALQTGYFPTE